MKNILNKTISVQVKKITQGRDSKIHLTIFHPLAKHLPTLVFEPENFEKMVNSILNNEKEN